MLALTNHRIRHALAFAMVLALCAASTGATRDDDYVARGMQLLRALYPGLKHVRVEIDDDHDLDLDNRPREYPDAVNPFSISLTEHHPQMRPWDPEYQKRPDPVLGAWFYFDYDRNLLKFLWVSGPFVDGRLDKIRKQADENPEWSDARVVEALKAAGAKYGPDDREAFLRALPLKELEPFTGRLEVVSARFDVRFHAIEGEKPKADLSWAVDAKWHSADGRYDADRTMIFEPFDGALMRYDIRATRPPWGSPK
jgi:hypothetical protein